MKLRDKLANLPFRSKLVLSYILMAFIPFVIFSFAIGSTFIRQAQRTAMEHTAQMIGQVSGSIDVYIGTIDKMASYIALELQNTTVLDVLAPSDKGWSPQEAKIERLLRNIAASHSEVAGILLATENDLSVSTGMSRISRDPFSDETWYRRAVQSPDTIQLISSATGRNIVTNEDYSVDDVFSLSKAVIDPVTGKVKGVILFDVRHDIIKSSINKITIGEKGFVFVTDEENNIVYTPMNPIVYRVNPLWLDGGDDQPVTARMRGESYQIRYEQSPYTGWKTVGVFSLDEVMGSVNTMVYILIACVLITLLVVLAVSFRLAGSVTRPILKLQKLMGKAEDGDLTVRFNSRGSDEIGALGESFNHMIDRIHHLINMVYVEQQNKRNAELKSLQEQIKPHFLYNTLDTISWMAREYNAGDIVRLVDALTNMFRIGLSHGKDIISVKEEMTHVSNYLYIQKIRYKDKLSYEIHVDEGLYRFQIPKLILQPLVENAIYHGIKQKRGGGCIIISAVLNTEENALRFSVSDSGAGMPLERVTELNQRLCSHSPADEKQSFGLFYIKERIQLCYGENFGVAFESAEGEGTTVTLTLPASDGMA